MGKESETKEAKIAAWDRRWSIGRWWLVVGFVIWIYRPAIVGGFIWDDVDIYIVENPLLRQADGIYRFWFTNDPVDYYPLTYTTFWLEWQLAGMDTRLYHATNVVLHVLCGLVLYMLLTRLNAPLPWLVCFWFLVHPLQLETVAWISQRKTLLGALFGFAAASEFVGYLQSGGRWRYARSVLWFALSLAGKPTLITLPVLLVAVDALQKPREVRGWVLRCAPFFALSLFFGMIGVSYQDKLIGGIDVRGQDLPARLASLGWVAWFYVLQTVRVWELCFCYPRWTIDGTSLLAWLPNLAVAAMAAGTWLKRKVWGWTPSAAWVVYLVTMLPALGIADVFFWRYSYVGDHYVYQSLPALLVLWAWLGAYLVQPWPRMRAAAYVAGVGVGLMLGVASFQRAFVYQSAPVIWRETLEKNPSAALAYSNLGEIEAQLGRRTEGLGLLQRAVDLRPSFFEVWLKIGDIHRSRRAWRQAIAAYERAQQKAPTGSRDQIEARVGCIAALYHLGRPDEAYSMAATMHADLLPRLNHNKDPLWAKILARLAVYEAAAARHIGRAGCGDVVASQVDRVLQRHPLTRRDLAAACEEVGEPGQALRLLQVCLEESPSDPELMLNCGRVALQLGRGPLAVEVLSRAAKNMPADPAVRVNLGRALLLVGDADSAIHHFSTAADLAPADSRIRLNLALGCAAT
ncbi:MAG: tetratricopeptide repeat protein, partial [Planctomycetota bacterium]